MIPLLIRFKIPHKKGRYSSVYLPLFIVWLLLFPLLILLLPVVLILGGLTWHSGCGRTIVFFYPLLLSLLWQLKGLTIDIQHKQNKLYLSFI